MSPTLYNNVFCALSVNSKKKKAQYTMYVLGKYHFSDALDFVNENVHQDSNSNANQME